MRANVHVIWETFSFLFFKKKLAVFIGITKEYLYILFEENVLHIYRKKWNYNRYR